jgi:hypothetical protein
VLAELTGVVLGTETLRTHTEQLGASVAAGDQSAIAHVLATQDPRPDRYVPVPDDQRLVIETDGVLVRYRGTGWHEVKVAEAVGCVRGNGRARDDPAYRAPQLRAPRYTAAREPSDVFEARLLALAAERGALDIVGYQQPPGTDPRLALWGEHTACLRPVVLLADGAKWIWALAARCFGDDRVEIVDSWHAVQHLWTVGKALCGEGTAATTAWVEAAKTELWTVGPLPVLQRLTAAVPPTPDAAEVLRVERAYFTTNAARMRYPSSAPRACLSAPGPSNPPRGTSFNSASRARACAGATTAPPPSSPSAPPSPPPHPLLLKSGSPVRHVYSGARAGVELR